VQSPATLLGISPFTQLLRQTAVIGMGPLAIGQAFCIHKAFHPGLPRCKLVRRGAKQLLERHTRGRCLRMQGEMHQPHIDIEFLL
jgi:hypothetical protein